MHLITLGPNNMLKIGNIWPGALTIVFPETPENKDCEKIIS